MFSSEPGRTLLLLEGEKEKPKAKEEEKKKKKHTKKTHALTTSSQALCSKNI